jgi:hypothetical protein
MRTTTSVFLYTCVIRPRRRKIARYNPCTPNIYMLNNSCV